MDITIVGAGPRGLIMAANLIKNHSKNEILNIDMYDPFPIGGRIWQTQQSIALIMNSPAQLVTLFNDFACTKKTGLTFYDWTQSNEAINFIKHKNYQHDFLSIIKRLTPDSYAPRALFGVYAQWFFYQLQKKLANNVSLNFHQEKIKHAVAKGNQYLLSTQQNDNFLTDKLILSTGNSNDELSENEQSFINYAHKNNLNYFLPNYPGETNLDKIKPDEKVLMRGMGLSFFDYLIKLTTERGGKFTTNKDGSYRYHPSGKEPSIFAGSRRGVPYYSKPLNQQKAGETRNIVFLTSQNIKASLVNGKLPFKKFINLLKAEIEYEYYPLLIAEKYPQYDAKTFKEGFIKSTDRAAYIGKYHFTNADIFDWDKILNPVAGTKISTIDNYQHNILQWINLIINDASLGNKKAPITGALSKIAELRSTIQKLVTDYYFQNDEYINKLLRLFSSFTGFLTAGPPLIRYRQLKALIDAKIVTILGPQLEIIGGDQQFLARSKFYPKEIFKFTSLIEARVPKPNLNKTTNQFLISLRDQGIITSHKFTLADGQKTISPAIDVDLTTYETINSKGQNNHNLFVWGVPLTGIEWLTTTLPHPLVDDHNFAVADIITQQIYN